MSFEDLVGKNPGLLSETVKNNPAQLVDSESAYNWLSWAWNVVRTFPTDFWEGPTLLRVMGLPHLAVYVQTAEFAGFAEQLEDDIDEGSFVAKTMLQGVTTLAEYDVERLGILNRVWSRMINQRGTEGLDEAILYACTGKGGTLDPKKFELLSESSHYFGHETVSTVHLEPQRGGEMVELGLRRLEGNPITNLQRFREDLGEVRRAVLDHELQYGDDFVEKPILAVSWLINSTFMRELARLGFREETGVKFFLDLRPELVRVQAPVPQSRVLTGQIAAILYSERHLKHFLSTGETPSVGAMLIPPEVFWIKEG